MHNQPTATAAPEGGPENSTGRSLTKHSDQFNSLFHVVAAGVHGGCVSATASEKKLKMCWEKGLIPSKLQSPVQRTTHGTGIGSTLNWDSAAGYPSLTLSLSQASVTTWTLRHCRAALHNSRQPVARAPSNMQESRGHVVCSRACAQACWPSPLTTVLLMLA